MHEHTEIKYDQVNIKSELVFERERRSSGFQKYFSTANIIFAQTKFYCAAVLSILFILSFSTYSLAQKAKKKNGVVGTPVLWRDPGKISSRDLLYGPGSAELAPQAPFTFIEEVKGGVSPKFEVRDAKGVIWRVKLGEEAQTETVSTRLVWSVGYFAEESYYFDRVQIKNLPKLSRGKKFVEGDSVVRGARFEPRRKNIERGPKWSWSKNPFAGTRELGGLKVIMVMLNNYDAQPRNNRILYVKNPETNRMEARYVVTDIGATLGRAGGFGGGTRSKNNLKDFQKTRFIREVEDGVVEFDHRTRPQGFGIISILYPPYYISEVKKERNLRKVPAEHALWIGSLLSQLTDEQLRDAFRAANYDSATTEGYVRAFRGRINQLVRLEDQMVVRK